MKYKVQNPNLNSQNPILGRTIFLLEFGTWQLRFFMICGAIVLLNLLACREKQQTDQMQKKHPVAVKQTEAQTPSQPLYQSPTFLSDLTGKTVQIAADSTSYDEQFGESYRILRILKEVGGIEKELSRRLLPVNASPDFRYRFADVYATDHQEWVIIQGHYFFFVYDVVNDRISKKIFPPKPKDFEAADAQSGRITMLAFEDNQLRGTAQDIGAFHFTINHLKRFLME